MPTPSRPADKNVSGGDTYITFALSGGKGGHKRQKKGMEVACYKGVLGEKTQKNVADVI